MLNPYKPTAMRNQKRDMPGPPANQDSSADSDVETAIGRANGTRHYTQHRRLSLPSRQSDYLMIVTFGPIVLEQAIDQLHAKPG